MYHYANQRLALVAAATFVEDLPPGTIFGITVTDDDNEQAPSVLNIFAPKSEWDNLKSLLHLSNPIDESESFTTYRFGPLEVSIQEPEENNGRESD